MQQQHQQQHSNATPDVFGGRKKEKPSTKGINTQTNTQSLGEGLAAGLPRRRAFRSGFCYFPPTGKRTTNPRKSYTNTHTNTDMRNPHAQSIESHNGMQCSCHRFLLRASSFTFVQVLCIVITISFALLICTRVCVGVLVFVCLLVCSRVTAPSCSCVSAIFSSVQCVDPSPNCFYDRHAARGTGLWRG